MNQTVMSPPRWTISTRCTGEVLAARVVGAHLTVATLGTPADQPLGDTETWLRELLGVAADASREPAHPTELLSRTLHQALSGLLFYHAELWARPGHREPASLVFVDGDAWAGFGWVGDEPPRVWVDGSEQPLDWTLVRDEAGHEGRAWCFSVRHGVRLLVTWRPVAGDSSGPSATFEAEWPPTTPLEADPMPGPTGPDPAEIARTAEAILDGPAAVAAVASDAGLDADGPSTQDRVEAVDEEPVRKPRRSWLRFLNPFAWGRREAREVEEEFQTLAQADAPAPHQGEATHAQAAERDDEPLIAPDASASPEATRVGAGSAAAAAQPIVATREPDLVPPSPEPESLTALTVPIEPEAVETVGFEPAAIETGPIEFHDPAPAGAARASDGDDRFFDAGSAPEPDDEFAHALRALETPDVAAGTSAAEPVTAHAVPEPPAAPLPEYRKPEALVEELVIEPVVAEAAPAARSMAHDVAIEAAEPAPVAARSDVGAGTTALLETDPELALALEEPERHRPPPRALRQPVWPEPEGPPRPAWKKPWAWGVLVLALFAGGWLVGRLEPGDGRMGLADRALRGLGFAAPRFSLTVHSRPPGAWIAVDGVDLAQPTPATLDLEAGEHEVTLSFSGLGSETRRVTGTKGQSQSIDVGLWGSLQVSALQGVKPVLVSLNGHILGTAPLVVDSLVPGSHRLEFRSEGLEPWERQVEVRVNQRAEVVAVPITGAGSAFLEVRATISDGTGVQPLAGAPVWIDGVTKGVTPLRIELPSGPVSIRVSHAGETAPIQVLDLPPGNQRFATFEFGLESDRPQLSVLPGAPRFPRGVPTLVAVALDGLRERDVRELWLHVSTPEGEWRRYLMSRVPAPTGVVGTAVFPAALFDTDGRARWYASVSAHSGDEYFTEIQTALLEGAPPPKARRPKPATP